VKHLQFNVTEWSVTFLDGTKYIVQAKSEWEIRDTYKFKGVDKVEFYRVTLSEVADTFSSRFD
jgi:hypothetical protein